MPLNNDYIIRVIVDGEDFLTGPNGILTKAAKNYQKDTNQIKNSTTALKKELASLEVSVDKAFRALESKATTRRGFAKIFDVSSREVTQDLVDQILKVRRVVTGELSSKKQGSVSLANFLGIDPEDIDDFEAQLRKLADIREKFTQIRGGSGNAERDLERRLKALFGLDANIKGIKEQVKETAAEFDEFERRGRNAFGGLADAARAAEVSTFLNKIVDAQRRLKFIDDFIETARKPQLALPAGARRAGPIGSTGEEGQINAAKAFENFIRLGVKVNTTSETLLETLIRTRGSVIDLSQEIETRMAPALRTWSILYVDIEEKTKRTNRAIKILTTSIGAFFTGLTNPEKFRQFKQDLDRLEQDIATKEARLTRRSRTLELERGDRGLTDAQTSELEGRRRVIDGLKHDANEARQALRGAENAFFRAGGAINKFIAGVNNLIHVRWFILVSFLTILAKTLISVGVALVEVASSAALAGAALGGAFAAGVLQAVAVAGLLQAAFSRISKVLDLAKQQEKLQVKSSSDTASQARAEEEAQERLAQATERRADALIDLAKARKEAARNLVDSAIAEKDANLSLKEAELGLIEAKRELLNLNKKDIDSGSLQHLQAQVVEAQKRLDLARQQGQEVEISAASQQLTIAQQNLNAFLSQTDTAQERVTEAQVAVKRAELNVEQARIRAKRATEDNKEAQKKGVEGSDQVVSALRGVRDATQAVTEAQEDLKETTVDTTAAQQALKDELADLSGAEKSLFDTVVALREKFQLTFRPVTDIIVSAVDRGLKKAGALLDDQRLIGAARGLASELGTSIDRLAAFTVSPEVRDALVFFIRQARSNLPQITTSLLNIAKAFLRIGQAGAPLFRELLGRFTGLTDRLEKFTRNERKLERFFQQAGKHLNSWIKFGKAIGNVLIQLGSAAAPSGKTLIDNLTEALERFAKFLEENKTDARAFFEEQRQNIEEFTSILFQLGLALFKAFNNSDLNEFVKLFIEILIPGFELGLKLINELARGLVGITKLPLIGGLAEDIIKLGVAFGIIRRLFPVIQNLDSLILKVFKSDRLKTFFDRLFVEGSKGARGLGTQIQKLVPIIEVNLKKAYDKAATSVVRLTKAIRDATIAQRIFNAVARAHPYILVASLIIALVGALIILERKFHILSDAVKRFNRDLRDTFRGLAGFVNDVYQFGRDLVDGLINGIKSKATDLKNSVIDIVKSPWEAAKAFFGISSPSTWTRDQIGVPLGEGIKVGIDQGLNGLGAGVASRLRGELATAEREANNAKNKIIANLSNLQFLATQQIGTRLEGQTPSEKALSDLDTAEAKRARSQQIASAKETVQVSQKEFNNAHKERIKAQKAFANAETKEQKAQARERVKNAKIAEQAAKEALEDANKQRAEVLHQAWVEEERARLSALAEQERKAVERSVLKEQERANKMFAAFEKALKAQDWAKAQKIFDRIVDLVGIKNLGTAMADQLVFGFLEGLKSAQKNLDKGAAAAVKKATVNATKETVAGEILQQSSQQGLIGRLGKQGLDNLSTLKFLINNDLLDLDVALEIVRKLSKPEASKALVKMLANEGLSVGDFSSFWEGTKGPKDKLAKYLRRFNDGKALKAFSDALSSLQIFQQGGQVAGHSGQPVPAIVHVGEWVLNKAQQRKLAARMGGSIDNVKNFLFGGGAGAYRGDSGGTPTSGKKKSHGSYNYQNEFYNLLSMEDPYGIPVWFIEFDNGSFGQISKGSALKIQRTKGRWFPQSVLNSSNEFTRAGSRARGVASGRINLPVRGRPHMALGGIVQAIGNSAYPSMAMKHYAEGGVVTASPQGTNNGSAVSKTVNQHFNVSTEGESDWNYIMRLSAIHAMG